LKTRHHSYPNAASSKQGPWLFCWRRSHLSARKHWGAFYRRHRSHRRHCRCRIRRTWGPLMRPTSDAKENSSIGFLSDASGMASLRNLRKRGTHHPGDPLAGALRRDDAKRACCYLRLSSHHNATPAWHAKGSDRVRGARLRIFASRPPAAVPESSRTRPGRNQPMPRRPCLRPT